jgi:hypothetical protein
MQLMTCNRTDDEVVKDLICWLILGFAGFIILLSNDSIKINSMLKLKGESIYVYRRAAGIYY